MCRYPAQVAVNATVTSLLSFIISFSTPTVCAFAIFVYLDRQGATWPIYPAVFVWIAAYVVASAICSAFKCAVDSIFLCAFKDMTPGPCRFMSDNLRDAFGIDSAHEDLARAGKRPRAIVDSRGKYSAAEVAEPGLDPLRIGGAN